MSLTYSDFYMPVFAIGDILCFARHGSLGLGNFYDRAPLSFFDRRPSRFIFCCTRRRIKAKKLRGTVWRRAFSVGLATLALTASSDGRTYA